MNISVYLNDPVNVGEDAPFLFGIIDIESIMIDQEIPYEGRIYKIIKLIKISYSEYDVLCNNIGVDPNFKKEDGKETES